MACVEIARRACLACIQGRVARLESFDDLGPAVERGLQVRRDIVGEHEPPQIAAHHAQLSVALPRAQGAEFHVCSWCGRKRLASGSISSFSPRMKIATIASAVANTVAESEDC